MEFALLPGKYIVAVSGGVDSMVLLHKLIAMPDVAIIVAHFDHGMRPDSELDRLFVEAIAHDYGLKFVYKTEALGSGASEATAREARYAFLRQIKIEYQAVAIVTAHHQDDALETAILNLSRGTGRRGLTALADTVELKRPLLNTPKAELLAYAASHKVQWHEDSTNTDQTYLRNYIRHSVLPRFGQPERLRLLSYIEKLRIVNDELDRSLTEQLRDHVQENQLSRLAIQTLPDEIAKEILIIWWRQNGFLSYESKTLKRALTDSKSGKTGSIIPLKAGYSMKVGRTWLALMNTER